LGAQQKNVVYDLRGVWGDAGGFFNFKALKWLKIDTKYLKNTKITIPIYATTFPPRFLKTYFSTRGPVPP